MPVGSPGGGGPAPTGEPPELGRIAPAEYPEGGGTVCLEYPSIEGHPDSAWMKEGPGAAVSLGFFGNT